MIYGNKYLGQHVEESDNILTEANMAGARDNYLNIDGTDKCSVWINPIEGPKPHCHINVGDKMVGCVLLMEPECFNHDDYMNLEFSSRGAKDLYNWMKKEYHGISNWRRLCIAWNNGPAQLQECNVFVPNKFTMPDYRKI